MCRCHLDYLRPNVTRQTSNGTSVINDEDDYGHQTVLHPSNKTTSGENMIDGQQEEESIQQTDRSQEGKNVETSLNEKTLILQSEHYKKI